MRENTTEHSQAHHAGAVTPAERKNEIMLEETRKVEIIDVKYYAAACDATGWPRTWVEIMSDGSARAVRNTEIAPGIYAPQVNGWPAATQAHADADGFFVHVLSVHDGEDADDNISAALLSSMQWLGYNGDTCPDGEDCLTCELSGRCPYEHDTEPGGYPGRKKDKK